MRLNTLLYINASKTLNQLLHILYSSSIVRMYMYHNDFTISIPRASFKTSNLEASIALLNI